MKTLKRNPSLPRNALLFSLAFFGATVATAAQARDQECASGANVVAKIPHDAAESLACLDAVASGGRFTALVLATKTTETANGGRDETNVATVVTGTLEGTGPAVKEIGASVTLADPALFPNGCGEYLKGGRVLPGTTKIALIYAQKIKTVDYADANRPVVATLNDRSVPGMASTCEGYMPGWNADRDTVTLNATDRTLSLKLRSRDPVEQTEPKKVGSQSAHRFYERTYDLACGTGSPEKASTECKDLKRARDSGTFLVRRKVYPETTTVLKY